MNWWQKIRAAIGLPWFPFTREGRQTLVYLVMAGCGPALTGVVIWAMYVVRWWPDASPDARLDKFAQLALCVAAALIIIVIALSCFVSIRAIKGGVGKDGVQFDVTGGESGDA